MSYDSGYSASQEPTRERKRSHGSGDEYDMVDGQRDLKRSKSIPDGEEVSELLFRFPENKRDPYHSKIRLRTYPDKILGQVHEFNLDTNDYLANKLKLTNGDILTHIGSLDISQIEHEIVIGQLHEITVEEEFSITVKKRNNLCRLTFTLTLDGKNISANAELISLSGDKSDTVVDLTFSGNSDQVIMCGNTGRALMWDSGTQELCQSPLREEHKTQNIFEFKRYEGIDTTDNRSVPVCSIRAFHLKDPAGNDMFVYATPKNIKLMITKPVIERLLNNMENLGKQYPMFFNQKCTGDITWFESLAFPGKYLAWNEDKSVTLKDVGEDISFKDLQRSGENIQFRLFDATPLKVTAV